VFSQKWDALIQSLLYSRTFSCSDTQPKRLFEKSKLLPEPPPSPPIWGALRFKVPQIGGLKPFGHTRKGGKCSGFDTFKTSSKAGIKNDFIPQQHDNLIVFIYIHTDLVGLISI
jgi:hypothetical protein